MPDVRDKGILANLKRVAEMEGFEEGTEVFEKRLRQLKVVKCREIRGMSTCNECDVFDYCDLAKKVMREHRGY